MAESSKVSTKMTELSQAKRDPATPDRWTLTRDIAVLQVKLVVDGLRDFLLVPVSLAAGILSLLKGGEHPGTEFYDLLRYGRRSERLINLFGAASRVHGPAADEESLPDIDDMVAKVETFVVDEYRTGGITAQAKEHFDQVLRSVRRMGLTPDRSSDDDKA